MLPRDKVMMGMLATIGIEPGKPFNPPEKYKAAMEKGIVDAYYYMQSLDTKLFAANLYWPDRHWNFAMVPDANHGFDFVSDEAVQIDKRAAAWFFFTFYPKVLTEHAGTVYLAPIADNQGEPLKAGRSYKLHIPKDIPAKQFWSLTIYDRRTWAFVKNPLERAGLGSFNKDTLKVNADGSIDLYFVRLIFVSQGIDTDSEQAEVLLATHGIVDSLYIRELAKKTHRGVEGRALQGFHTGGRCFGYRSVPIEDPTRTDSYGRPQIVGVRLEVHPEQATIVRRIFADYAAGDSITTIAKKLNAEGVTSPAPYRGQSHPSWAPSAISVMLHNERYCGTAVWNRTRKIRDPKTGRRVQRVRPRAEWTVVESPHLRIVSDEISRAVANRLASVNANFSSGAGAGLSSRSYTARYLFSGFLKCGLCGSNIVLISGRGGVGWAKYGCPLHQNRGICSNALVVRRDRIEQELISGLQREVLREDLAAFAVDEFKRQPRARLDDTRSHLAVMRNKREKLKAEIVNLARAIAEGHRSAALLDELGNRERELDSISDELLAADGRGLDARLQEIGDFVQKRLQDIRGLLLADVPRAKAELSKHCTAITLTPEASSFRISGDWNLLGGRSDGAGGTACTVLPHIEFRVAA